MKKKILLLLISFFFVGCNQSATSVFKKDPIYAQHLQYTKVLKVFNKENNVQAIANITYLNSVDSSKYNNKTQNFLVGIYIENGDKNEYVFTMNGINSTNITLVDKEDELYKNIAFKNNWAEYFIYTFNDSEQKNLTLKYLNPKIGFGSVSFVKE